MRKSGEILGESPFLLVGDHAGHVIPAALDGLGLSDAERTRHIACDFGVEALGLALAETLKAPFVRQVYSRLVIDCNRLPERADSVPAVSDETLIPGNAALSEEARRRRRDTVFEPYHRAIDAMLHTREMAGLETILVSLHSFTPVMAGLARSCQIGVLHDGHEDTFARSVLARLREYADLAIEDNHPYRMDETDYTVPRHAFARRLPYVEFEVRQDLIAPPHATHFNEVTALIADALQAAVYGD